MPVFAFHAARYATTTGVVGHQDEITASQADESGQRGALVASLILFDLNDQFLAFVYGILDAGTADIHTRFEIGAGNFLERKKSVAVGAVFDERSFETGFDPSYDTFVYIAFFLFFTSRFNVEVQ